MTLPASEETVVPATDRAAFEKWLMEVHGLDSPWNEQRNCFDDWPAHLAFKAWQAGSEQAVRECAEIARKVSDDGHYYGDSSVDTASSIYQQGAFEVYETLITSSQLSREELQANKNLIIADTELLEEIRNARNWVIHWIADFDHGLKPTRESLFEVRNRLEAILSLSQGSAKK